MIETRNTVHEIFWCKTRLRTEIQNEGWYWVIMNSSKIRTMLLAMLASYFEGHGPPLTRRNYLTIGPFQLLG
jgi:hypothetical protein